MTKLLFRIERWWLSRSESEKLELTGLFWVSAIYLAHYLVFCIIQPFYIEDAGISFAYAKHFAEGEGFVTYPGGERVEGFSNPLWTFLIAAFYWIGLDFWSSSKIMGAFFGLIALPCVYRISRRFGLGSKAAFLGPAMLALSPQFVIWNASGLENSLYVCLLAAGVYRLLVEDQEGGRPWSALLFCGVCMTRPEGMMYAFLAFFSKGVFALVDRRFKPLFFWLICFLIPFGLYHAWRIWYFSWSFPNTYYAKLGASRFEPFLWTKRGWMYINSFLSLDTHKTYGPGNGLGYALPLLAFGLTGMKGWRLKAALFLLVPASVFILWDGQPDKEGFWAQMWFSESLTEVWLEIAALWIKIRVWFILFTALALGVLNLGRPGWRARSVMWAMGASSVFFILYSGDDWMKAHRWFNVVVLFLHPILAAGLIALVSVIPKSRHLSLGVLLAFLFFGLALWDGQIDRPASWYAALHSQWVWVRTTFSILGLLAVFCAFRALPWFRWRIPAFALVLWMPIGAYAVSEFRVSSDFAVRPETAVTNIHTRVRYMQWVQRKLDVDHVTLLDVDMGAHMIYSGWDIVDIAGLVDVPMGQHGVGASTKGKESRKYKNAFLKDYIFDERNPEFAHVHGNWAKRTRIPSLSPWKNYFEIPGYPISRRKVHIGNHIRKDLFMTLHDPNRLPVTAKRLKGKITLLGSEVRGASVAPGGQLFFSTQWAHGGRQRNVQVLVGIVNDKGLQSVSAFQPGYRWLEMPYWKRTEKVKGIFPIGIPNKLPLGEYRLIMAVLDMDTGLVLAPIDASNSDKVDLIAGEFDLNLSFSVVETHTAYELAESGKNRAIKAADSGDCESAWTIFKDASRHVYKNHGWKKGHQQDVKTAIAKCFLQSALTEENTAKRIEHLIDARFWDHRIEGLLDLSSPLAEELDLSGQEKAIEARAADISAATHVAVNRVMGIENKLAFREALNDNSTAATKRSKSLWQSAFDDFSTALKLDPSRSWTRHRAEEARDGRLRILRPYQQSTPKK